MKITGNLTENIEWLERELPIGKSFDIVTRGFNLGGQAAFYIGINGLCDAELLQKIVSDLEPPEGELETGQVPKRHASEQKNEAIGREEQVDAAEYKIENPQKAELQMQGRGEAENRNFWRGGMRPQGTAVLENNPAGQLETYIQDRIGYVQTVLEDEKDTLLLSILSGQAVFLLDGYDRALVLDVRSYPDRSPDEPDTEAVLGGAQDGFVETLMVNTNLIRRRIRSLKLVFELLTVGKESRTDVSLCYLDGYADAELVQDLREKITSLEVTALTLGAKSLEELLMPKSWLHPLPTIQTTQRPDTACSYLLEGHVIVMVDNTPMVLLFPCSIFQFTQSAEDYYKSPVVGTYFRTVRFFCLLLALFLTPVFLLLINSFPEAAEKLNLAKPGEISNLQIFIYVLAMEFGLDLFRYSSMHAASRYSGPLSIIGGLIAGDIAVSLNWATEETVFYAAITLLATIALASIEFGEGIRIYRIFLIFVTGLGGLAGAGWPCFLIGTFLILLSVSTTPVFGRYHYLWPLFPLNWPALKALLLRYPTAKAQPSRVWKRK